MNTDVIITVISVWFLSLVVLMGIMRDNTKHDIEDIVEKKLNELKQNLN